MIVHDSAAKTYKTLNDAGRSHDECLREAANAVIEELAKMYDAKARAATDRYIKNMNSWGRDFEAGHSADHCKETARDIRALSDGGQKND